MGFIFHVLLVVLMLVAWQAHIRKLTAKSGEQAANALHLVILYSQCTGRHTVSLREKPTGHLARAGCYVFKTCLVAVCKSIGP